MSINYNLKTGDRIRFQGKTFDVIDTFPSWVRLSDGQIYGYEQLKNGTLLS
jgi:hypothetical protein